MKSVRFTAVEFVLVIAALCTFADRAYKAERSTRPANCPPLASLAAAQQLEEAPSVNWRSMLPDSRVIDSAPTFGIFYHNKPNCRYKDVLGFTSPGFIGHCGNEFEDDGVPRVSQDSRLDWREITPQLLPCPKCVSGQLGTQKPDTIFVPA